MLTQMFPNVVNISLTYNCFSLFVANKLMNTETVSYPSIFQNGEYLYSPRDVMQAEEKMEGHTGQNIRSPILKRHT